VIQAFPAGKLFGRMKEKKRTKAAGDKSGIMERKMSGKRTIDSDLRFARETVVSSRAGT
jgi:hypothetical protein